MGIPLYLAMTAAELHCCTAPPTHIAWLSCLFSPYGTGLSNLPKQLPPNSLLILSDRTPVCGHDPKLIKTQLQETIDRLCCRGVLLDFERPPQEESKSIAKELVALPCPVAVSAAYADALNCPVFLPSIPPHIPPGDYLSPWSGRDIWLEAATGTAIINITEKGFTSQTIYAGIDSCGKFHDTDLFCHYDITVTDSARFTLTRTVQDMYTLLEHAEAYGVTNAIGLYQELG